MQEFLHTHPHLQVLFPIIGVCALLHVHPSMAYCVIGYFSRLSKAALTHWLKASLRRHFTTSSSLSYMCCRLRV